MSDYKPYRSFQEWTVAHHKEHTPEFLARADSIINRLYQKSLSNPGVKFKAQKIADAMGLTHGVTSAALRYLRNEGYPVCSDADGYWYSDRPEDIQQTINQLQDRIYAMQYSIGRLNAHLKK